MRIKKIAITSLIGIILILPISALAETLTIQPNADTFFTENMSPPDVGSYPDLRVATGTDGDDRRSVLRFDFSALPEGATITDATLNLYYQSSYGDPVGRTHWVYEITQTAWTETGATWNEYSSGNSWATAGGDYTITDGSSTIIPASFGWVSWNILALAQNFQISEIAEFLIKDETEGGCVGANCGANFWSRDYTTDPLLQPKLVITYTEAPVCGNDIKEAGEVCDGIDLGGETCVSQGFESGTLICAVGCGSFDTSGCSYVPTGAGNILPIGTDFPVSALAYVGELFGDIYPYIGLLIGIPLAFWIIGNIIDTAKKKKRGRKFN